MTPDFSQLIAKLTDAGFEFVIVGGYAAVTHGSSQVTRDLDVCARLNETDVALLRKALADWNPKHRMLPQRTSFLTAPPPGVHVHNLYLQTDLGVLDVLGEIKGVGDYERLRSAAEEVEVDGRTCWVISLDDLIVAKDAMDRDKDIMTAKELRAIAAKRKR